MCCCKLKLWLPLFVGAILQLLPAKAQEIIMQCGTQVYNPVMAQDKASDYVYFMDSHLIGSVKVFELNSITGDIDSFVFSEMNDDPRYKLNSFDVHKKKIAFAFGGRICIDEFSEFESQRIIDTILKRFFIHEILWTNDDLLLMLLSNEFDPKGEYGLYGFNMQNRELKEIKKLNIDDMVYHSFKPTRLLSYHQSYAYILQPSIGEILQINLNSGLEINRISLNPSLTIRKLNKVSSKKKSFSSLQRELMHKYDEGKNDIPEELFVVKDGSIVIGYTVDRSDSTYKGIRKYLVINNNNQMSINLNVKYLNPFKVIPLELKQKQLLIATITSKDKAFRILEIPAHQ